MNTEMIEACTLDIINYTKDCILHYVKTDDTYIDECGMYYLLTILESSYKIMNKLNIDNKEEI